MRPILISHSHGQTFTWSVVPEHVKSERLERERIASERRLAELAQKEQEAQQRLAEQRQQQLATQNQKYASFRSGYLWPPYITVSWTACISVDLLVSVELVSSRILAHA